MNLLGKDQKMRSEDAANALIFLMEHDIQLVAVENASTSRQKALFEETLNRVFRGVNNSVSDIRVSMLVSIRSGGPLDGGW